MAQRRTDRDRRYSAEEFMAIAGSDPNWELIEGKIESVCAASFDASAISLRLGTYLSVFVTTRGLGILTTTDGSFVISRDPDTTLQPDIGFARMERVMDPASTARAFEGAPDLAVEVRSPTDSFVAIERKVQRYLDAGTSVTWIVDPLRRSIFVRTIQDHVVTTLTGADDLDGGDVLPGFRIPVEEVFAIRRPVRIDLVLPAPG